MKIIDLLKEFNFSDFKDTFLNIYGEYDGLDFLNEFENIYNFYKENGSDKSFRNILVGEVVIVEQSDGYENGGTYRELALSHNGEITPLSAYSWFLTPPLQLSQKMLETYSKEEILSHYLYHLGYNETFCE